MLLNGAILYLYCVYQKFISNKLKLYVSQESTGITGQLGILFSRLH